MAGKLGRRRGSRRTLPDLVGGAPLLVLAAATAVGWVGTAWAAQPTAPAGGTPVFWYLARATGFTAYLLLFLDVWLGLLLWRKDLDTRIARWRLFDLHQFTGMLGTGFLLVHVASLLADPFIGYTLPELLVPFASPYRPLPTALGVVGFYLFLLVAFSFSVRRRIGHRVWRGLHYFSFVVWLLALAHGVFAGTDTAEAWARVLYGVTGLSMAYLMLRRFTEPGGAAGRALAAGD